MKFSEKDFVNNLTDPADEFTLEPVALPEIAAHEPYPPIIAASAPPPPSWPAVNLPLNTAAGGPKTAEPGRAQVTAPTNASPLDLRACSRPWVLLRLRAALSEMPADGEREFQVVGGSEADFKAFQTVANAIIEPGKAGAYRLRRKPG